VESAGKSAEWGGVSSEKTDQYNEVSNKTRRTMKFKEAKVSRRADERGRGVFISLSLDKLMHERTSLREPLPLVRIVTTRM